MNQEYKERVSFHDSIKGSRIYSPTYKIPIPDFEKKEDFKFENMVCVAIAHLSSDNSSHLAKIVYIKKLPLLNKEILTGLNFRIYKPTFVYLFDKYDAEQMIKDIKDNCTYLV